MTFRRMRDATRAEWETIERLEEELYDPADGALALLETLRDAPLAGHPVNGWDHSLQAATRALRAGEPDDMVVACLLHDSAVGIAPANHGQVAAEILRPYVSDEVYWVVKHHGIVQKLSMVNHPYWGESGAAEAAVAPIRSNPYFARTVQFCNDYDGASFDPSYDTLPLSAFREHVDRVFHREAFRPA
jgi:predicted HD phosphohydrolase